MSLAFLNSLLAKTGIEINVDYSNYDNFIHFSSAQTRLENFYYKLELLEEYNATKDEAGEAGAKEENDRLPEAYVETTATAIPVAEATLVEDLYEP